MEARKKTFWSLDEDQEKPSPEEQAREEEDEDRELSEFKRPVLSHPKSKRSDSSSRSFVSKSSFGPPKMREFGVI